MGGVWIFSGKTNYIWLYIQSITKFDALEFLRVSLHHTAAYYPYICTLTRNEVFPI